MAAVFDALQNLLAPVLESKFEPSIILDDSGNFVDVVPFKLRRYTDRKAQDFPSFNMALDEFYLRVTATEKAVASVETNTLQLETQRLKRIVTEQEKSVNEDQAKSEHDKQIGNTIYKHLNELQAFQNQLIKANNQGHDWNTIVKTILEAKKSGKSPAMYFESFDGKNLALNLSIDNLHLSINLRDSLFDNANRYYEKGKHSKEKAQGALIALQDSKKKLALTEKELAEAEKLKNLKPAEILEAMAKRKIEQENRMWYEKFRWFTTSDDFLVVAGKDTVSNEVLIKKYTSQEDIVFHAEITGSPFVVIKSEGKTVSEQALQEAGEFAASFSRAWRENAGSADVYWVKVDQLSKSGPSGESVPHGAFFVVGKRNWFRNTKLRIAVGIIVGEETSFVGGPVDAVKAKTKNYVVISPGDLSGKELLGQILKALKLKLSKEHRDKTGKTSIEQIREFVPYTKGTINQKPN
jgi:predicted ribosome quality control (RQC) complex YloA/Tae2 family protein